MMTIPRIHVFRMSFNLPCLWLACFMRLQRLDRLCVKKKERNKQRKKQTKTDRKDIGEKSKRATTTTRNNTTKGFGDFYDKLKII